MHRYFTILILLFWQPLSAQQDSADPGMFSNRGEVYFKLLPAGGIPTVQLPGWISVDRIEADGSLTAYARQEKLAGWDPGKAGFSIVYQQHPGTLIEPEMRDHIDLKETGDWDYYPTYDAYLNLMEQFQEEYPDLCQVFSIGQSGEGREIMMAVITSSVNPEGTKPRVLYTGTIHGDETAGYVLFLRLAHHLLSRYGSDPAITDLVDDTEIWINPLSNPDGTFAGGNASVNGATRFNAAGVDLNRNYPDPEDGDHPDGNPWQPETMVFMELAGQTPFSLSLNCHGGAEVFNYPWDTWEKLHADDDWWYFVGREWADTVHAHAPAGYFDFMDNGVTNGYQWYSISGGRQDYMNYFHHCREVTLEISNVKLLPASQLPAFWEYNHRSFLNYIEQVRYGLRGRVTDAGTGDPVSATVYIEGHDMDNSWVATNSAGWYFRPIFEGTYSITFFAPAYGLVTHENISSGNYGVTQLDVQLEYTGSGISGAALQKMFMLSGNPGGPFSLRYLGEQFLEAKVQLVDAAGRPGWKMEKNFAPGSDDVAIPVDGPGMYYLQITYDGGGGTFKLIRN